MCRAGFSTCSHAYAISGKGLRKLLSLVDGDQKRRLVMPIDDFLPGAAPSVAVVPRSEDSHRLLSTFAALYSTHPRDDVNTRMQQALLLSQSSEDSGRRGSQNAVEALAFRNDDIVFQLDSFAHFVQDQPSIGPRGRYKWAIPSLERVWRSDISTPPGCKEKIHGSPIKCRKRKRPGESHQ